MYKLLLCLRYLRTRYIALASIISVMLGVATMIVVNSVMSGFATEMQNRIHGILSDVVVETRSISGEFDDERAKALIRQVAGEAVEGMTTTVVVPALLSFRYGDNTINRQVQLIGIDEETINQVSDFSKYLQHPENRKRVSFDLHDGGYDTHDHQAGPESPERAQMAGAGWGHRAMMAQSRELRKSLLREPQRPADHSDVPPDPFVKNHRADIEERDPAKQQETGLILGIVLASIRDHDGKDRFLVLPGDDVALTFPNAPGPNEPPKVFYQNFTIVDFYECKMSEYDASFVFVPLRKLQEARGMIDPLTRVSRFNSIQIKLAPGADGDAVRDKLRTAFGDLFVVQTWRDRQGPLLAAVQMETAILNVLLFMIIAVSGFSILAIFFMIVVEKTRDIGILKSLGASGTGIMGIFLSYGLSLGLVGSGVGMILGLEFAWHINGIANVLGKITGRPVFDPSIYYFYKIPTLIDPWTVTWIVAGAVGIAAVASVLPALRAALLRPVEALRYE